MIRKQVGDIRMKNKYYEIDLYEPVRNHFKQQGYIVHGEVNDCDIVAMKVEKIIIIELKLTINIDLLLQITKRQKLTEFVYVAILHPTYSLRSRKWRDICHLLRRLEVGLLTITFKEKAEPKVRVIHEPGDFDRMRSMRQSKQKKDRLLKEIKGRRISTNIGGSHQKKIHTAYKEACIYIACCLIAFGPLSPKLLRQIGTGEKTYAILYHNYEGWFKKVERGIYTLTEKGEKEYKKDQQIVDYYEALIRQKE